ncbi:uncharacterized protein [Miscanthus floridulus]|uniref:uncharacterized protein n=1 Tax=Miscanthus floridulus TaxID=154761 RepID=UPI00345A5317
MAGALPLPPPPLKPGAAGTNTRLLLHTSIRPQTSTATSVHSAALRALAAASGVLQGHSISILVDSGSSHTFLGSKLSSSLTDIQLLQPVLSVQVANGEILQCDHHLPNAVCFSPMQIHWQQKWIAIPYNDSTAVLIGDAPEIPVGSVLQLSLVQSDSGEQSITSELLPPEFNALLTEFAHLFKPPTELPPQRDCDHSIPLIPGSHPVFVRPYRYAPVLKNEIERQVADMLEQGLIQKIKGKYPVPIIDELLDELSGAKYFTSLDLQAGFHQIRMKPGEEYKTQLKEALCQSPVLALPNFARPFCIETDASDNGIGAVLMQDGHPLAYLSKSLGPKSRGLSTYEKEYMAILLAIQSWRSYLQFQEFVILTDQKSLTQLSDQRLHTSWQQKVFSKLVGLQYRIVYRKGTDNRAADALSRHPAPPAICAAVSTMIPSWIASVTATYDSDPSTQDIIANTAYHPQSDGQTERLNQCLETYLRCFVHACPSKWSKWLATAEFWYNTSEHSAIGRSPFEALYGYPPRLMAVPPRPTLKLKLLVGPLTVLEWISYSRAISTELSIA